MVRIFKNLRNRLVDSNNIEKGLAPSYYLEGLLYNVPNDKFGSSYVDSFVNVFNYLDDTDRSKFLVSVRSRPPCLFLADGIEGT